LRYFPFTAIVEQGRLKQALLLNAVNPAVGGVLIMGPSGTGKSTAVRGLAELLPEIDVVADCAFSCDPADPCDACRARPEALPVARRRRRIVDLPLNATEDRVAGSVDVARALTEGVRALEPGLLAEANRGILYVDEINLLADHLVDSMLDAAATGIVRVEREAVSVVEPARFLLVAATNPCPCGGGPPGSCDCDDGARLRYLRRLSGPLLDRFDLRVGVARPGVDDLLQSGGGESTAAAAARVQAARTAAIEARGVLNSEIPASHLDILAPLEPAARLMLRTELERERLTGRGYHRIRRVARTIADLSGDPSAPVGEQDVAMALQLRVRMRVSVREQVA